MPLHLPEWLEDSEFVNDPTARRLAYNRFVLRSAALHSSPKGHLVDFAAQLGVNYSTLASWCAEFHGIITPEAAIKMEKLLGRELFPRALFRPDHFC